VRLVTKLERVVIIGVVVSSAWLTIPAGPSIASASDVSPVFDRPMQVAVSGSHVFVGNIDGSALITELNASNGSTVRVIKDGKSNVIEFALSGPDIWIINYNKNAVYEVNSNNGHLIRTVKGTTTRFVNYRGIAVKNVGSKFNSPQGIAVANGHVFVSNLAKPPFFGGSFTELNASNGAVIHVIQSNGAPESLFPGTDGPWFDTNLLYAGEIDGSNGELLRGFAGSDPVSIADNGRDAWGVTDDGASVSEVKLFSNYSTLVTKVDSGADDFNDSGGIAISGANVWVTNTDARQINGNSVTELNASTGAVVRVLNSAKYQFNGPWGIASGDNHIWVANAGGNSVTEFNANNGSLIRVIKQD
jgi:hypothetical protein